ncbi:MAG: hypothetical protein OHK0019_37070 [Saprospiraceae bacterium]
MRDFAVRALLIVLSVWLALFLNNIREQQQVTADLKIAYQNLRAEVERNRDTLAAAVEYHRQTMSLLDSLLKENKSELTAVDLRLYEINVPKLQDAAWTTLHTAGLSQHLKFNDLYPLTKLYQSQEAFLTSQAISHDRPDLKDLLQFFEQEKRLLSETNTVLGAGQNWRYLE